MRAQKRPFGAAFLFAFACLCASFAHAWEHDVPSDGWGGTTGQFWSINADGYSCKSPADCCSIGGWRYKAETLCMAYPGTGYEYAVVTLGKYTCPAGTLFSGNGQKNGIPTGGTAPACIATPTCPSGQSWNETTGQCTVSPSCPTGKVWNGSACVIPETAPESCADNEIASVDDTGAILGCTALAQPENCSNPLGYFNGSLVCGDAKAQCEATGGFYGQIGGQDACVPGDYSPPICSGTGALYMTAGGFVCESPSTTPPAQPGDVNEPSDGQCTLGDCNNDGIVDDTDNDGIPDNSDTDHDADGDGNVDDSNGDGVIDNEQDPLAGQVDANHLGRAGASGSCAVAPQCTGGDPQLCALLRQQWEAMCRQPRLLEDVDEAQAGVYLGRADVSAATALDDYQSGVEGALDDALGTAADRGPMDNSNVPLLEGFFLSLVPSASTACTGYTMAMPRYALVIGCEWLNWWKQFAAWVLYLATAWYVVAVAFAPAHGKGE